LAVLAEPEYGAARPFGSACDSVIERRQTAPPRAMAAASICKSMVLIAAPGCL
jgi:hypothetical protein